ncbi:MAG: hypothetical protein LKF50_06260 [Solobacterium sp.]|jgi:hypothetical protein|nr:hypothetical protein [Solobacterium sp.]MCH4223188.1 hypothetical protein [Solobacterium sp.]
MDDDPSDHVTDDHVQPKQDRERIFIHLRQLLQNMTQSYPAEVHGSQSEYMTVNGLAAVRDTGLSYLKRMLRIVKQQQRYYTARG